MQLRLYRDDPSSDGLQGQLRSDDVFARLEALESRARRKGLESLDPSKNSLIGLGMELDGGGRVVRNNYGVLSLARCCDSGWPEAIEQELAEIREGIRRTHSAPLQFVIWAGASEAVEDKAMYSGSGLLRRGPRAYVLDSSDPAKLQAILDDATRRSRLTLAGVLKRSLVAGVTGETGAAEAAIGLKRLEALYRRQEVDGRPNIASIAPAGSPLDEFARQKGYRRAGSHMDALHAAVCRHSAPLGRSGLYALGLAKTDLGSWTGAANLTAGDVDCAFRTAAFLHAQGCAGRDQVTLSLPAEWSAAAAWTKRNFEESLGRSGQTGIRIVTGEKLRMSNYRAPRDQAQDRVFLSIQLKGGGNGDSRKIELIRRAGYPAAILTFSSGSQLSSYLQAVHWIVFGMARLRRVNFVTQPETDACREIAGRLHAAAVRSGGIEGTREWKLFRDCEEQAKWRARVTLRWDRLEAAPVDAATAPAIYASMLKQAFSSGQAACAALTFFGDMRYAAGGRAARMTLERAAGQVFRSLLRVPAEVAEGPGASQEMNAGFGRCFSTVILSEAGDRLAEAGSERDYHVAQFLAVQVALAARNRPVVSITLKDLGERSLAALSEFFSQAARHLKE